LPLAQAPTISYPELIKSGATMLLVGLLSHENMDIVIDAVEVIHEFTDEDVGGEDEDEEEDEDGQVTRKSEEALKALIDSLVCTLTTSSQPTTYSDSRLPIKHSSFWFKI
jgi:beta-catenin-like protein 1